MCITPVCVWLNIFLLRNKTICCRPPIFQCRFVARFFRLRFVTKFVSKNSKFTMSNGGYKLTYFNARGLCEPIRFIFALADVNFEDIRVPIKYNGDVPVIPQILPSEIKESKQNVRSHSMCGRQKCFLHSQSVSGVKFLCWNSTVTRNCSNLRL